ncbi:MAG: hypothetical protein K2Q10_11100, partial [Rhodospirillales bacterium]|nr:hypothetical protein [Rhodospirillales bacterium]
WIAYSSIRGSSATAATGSAAEYGYGSTANAGFTTSESAEMMNTGYTEGGYESDSRYGSGTSYDRGNGGGESMGERAGRITEGVRESASRIAGQAQSRASRMARTASRQASVAADRSREMFNDHPLTAGMFALAAGAILGAVLPRTRSEDRMMGEARDQVIGQAREVGNETMYKARRVASRAAEAASEQGSELVRRTREAAQDEASRQNLGSMESPSGMPH